VGSAVDLSQRLKFYYSSSALEGSLIRGRSHIYSAILKDGLENFSLSILEYCEAEKCIEREGYFIKLLVPAYNIIQDPTLPPMTGRTHSAETFKQMSEAQQGENHPMFGKTHSDETRKKISDSLQGRSRPSGSGNPSQKIEVFDKDTNLTTSYESIREAERTLHISNSSISCYLGTGKLYKDKYIFTKVG
jgi:group I intron endonuclease